MRRAAAFHGITRCILATAVALPAVASFSISIAVPAAFAADPPAAPAASASASATASPDSQLEKARALFRSGVAVLQTGDYERALDLFLRSRDAYPSPQNSMNAAACLYRLGRFDESLELYETTLATLSDKLDESDRAAIATAVGELRPKVANLDVSANVDGAIIIDGRQRGKLPLAGTLRLLAGSHVVRIVKDGYRTYETTVEIKAGERAHVDAKLEPLAEAGQLRIEDPSNVGADVFVDGALVGKAPWEGTLGPGAHAVWSVAGDSGSAPTRVVVLQGQTALVRLKSGPLGPAPRITVRPDTAAILLGGVSVGTGTFTMRLPVGEYTVEAREPGYFPLTEKLTVDAEGPSHMDVDLTVDPSDPRWPKPVVREIGHLWVGAFGGLAWGPTFGSAAEAGCPSLCSGTPGVFGGAVGARAGFRFQFDTSIELSAGYLAMGLSSQRTRTDVFPTNAPAYTVHYTLDDDIRYAGALLAVGASQKIRLRRWLYLVPRASIGVFLANVRNPVTGTASTTGSESVPVQIQGAGNTVSATRAVIAPEIGAMVPWSGFELGLGLQVAFLPGSNVNFTYGSIQVPPNCPATNPGAVGCAPSSSVIAGERALGAFYVLMPQLSVSRVF